VTFSVLVARLTPSRQLGTGPVAPAKDTRLAANSVAASATVDVPPGAQSPQSPVANDMSTEVSHSKLSTRPTNPLVVTASNHRVRSGEHFAEIRAHRSARSGSDTRFVWWTEAASAKPGVDYVPQDKATQSFPKGKSSTSFFVKLVPNASRTQPEVFYVAIAEAHHPSSSGHVTRAAVWLPPNDEHSAAVAARNETSAVGAVGAADSIKPELHPTGAD
jgi:hypothetical protein